MTRRVIALVALSLACAAPARAEADACRGYGATLHAMVVADQALRERWTFEDAPPGAPVPRIVALTNVVDRRNTEQLKRLVAACGWPTRSRFGPAAVGDAWLLAQHADHDRRFQRRVLGLLKTAVAAGEAPADQLAYLADRVALADGRPQLYGTQLDVKGECGLEFRTLDDPAKVEARRRAIGWPTLEQYRQLVREHALPEHCRTSPASP